MSWLPPAEIAVPAAIAACVVLGLILALADRFLTQDEEQHW